MEEYRRIVEAYAARHENYLFHNEGNEHALIIFENIFKNANDTIRIAANNLCNSEVVDRKEYVEPLIKFLDNGGTLKILLNTPIWLERIFICFITPIMHLIARLSSFFAKKLRRSEIIFVSLLTALKFYLYCLAIVKILIFCELYKLQSLLYSKITLNHACEFSLAKL